MPTTKTSSNASKPRAAAPKRKPAARGASTAKPAATGPATSSTRPSSRVAQVGQLAERAVLIPVGAALEARDRVADLVATTRSRDALGKRLAHFERRGGRVRAQLEREVRRTRTRVERRARSARRDLDRQRTQARRNLGSNVENLSARVETVVQNGVNVGIKLVNGAQDRISRFA
jgi:hypothetical protein